MRVLFDIVHPADVLFFYNTIRALEERGDEYLILSRHKDVTCVLLDQFGLAHKVVSTAGKGTLKLGAELIKRDFAVLREAKRFKPHVMIGFGGVAISHVGKILGIPSVSFYAADTATLQNSITWPFISHLYVPEPYAAKTPKGRTTRFKGLKERSYFHPDSFVVDESKALKNGWMPGVDNFFIRAVMWRANHDIGKSGWSDETFITLIKKLETRGQVHISSERPLPAALRYRRYQGKKTEVHHLMAKCKLYVGESATMAQEAAFLGTQAIYDGHDIPGTTQSILDAGLVSMPSEKTDKALFELIDELLDAEVSIFQDKHEAYMAEYPNMTGDILNALERHAKVI